jgi:hypothetical protein
LPSRVSQKDSNKNKDKLHLLLVPKLKPPRLPLHQPLKGKSQSIFSRPQLLLLEDVVVQLVEEQETFSVPLELVQVLEPRPVDWVISISSETTHNFNNYAKSFNNNLKCSSLSSNKLAPVIHNWHS